MRQLTSDERRLWRLFLTLHSATMPGIQSELRRFTNLSLVDFEVLSELGANGGRMRMSELAGSMGVSRSGMTRCVDRLRRRGLVDRAAVPDDKRGAFAVITPSGLDHLDEVAHDYESAVHRRFTSLLSPAERRVLFEVFERMRAGPDGPIGGQP